MLRHHQQYKFSIMRAYLLNLIQAGDNDKCLLEDAIAIVGFNETQGNALAIENHFNQWVSKELPDPIQGFDKYRITELYRIFSRVGLLIEDYMSKATSSTPVLAYLNLPKIVYTDTDTGNRVTLDDLTTMERHRLFRAFLKFELLCKVFDPQVADALGADQQWARSIHLQSWYEDDDIQPGSERYWTLAHASWQTLDPLLYESLHCVRDYLQACYGAVFAHVAWADRYPAFLDGGPRKKNLLYPDNMYVSSYAYFDDLRMPQECEYLTDWTVCQGIDLLFHLLNHTGKGTQGTQNMRSWLYSIYSENPISSQSMNSCFLFRDHPGDFSSIQTHIRLPEILARNENLSPDSDWIYSNSSEGPPSSPYSNAQGWKEKYLADYAGVRFDQLRIFRQRAWIFGDNARLFPPVDIHFPDIETLSSEKRHGAMDRLHSDHIRQRRRSPEWQNLWAGRTMESRPAYHDQYSMVEFPRNHHSRIPVFYGSTNSQDLTTFWRHV
ncbi:hypothetical protein FPOA_00040 [Fusarium poae]|uniref:Uncharacterized protein n=1 Tax=Fusarium poae TaxID=36050 RepID=A0A1B8B088_FUSPO|nr:hypothetical protein FPOA_00040 [Fusarium poae]